MTVRESVGKMVTTGGAVETKEGEGGGDEGREEGST